MKHALHLMSAVAAALALLLPTTASATDLNCNGIEFLAEDLVDLGDPVCEANTDDEGEPYPHQDYYFWYEDFGCLYPVINNDQDGDGLGFGPIQVTDPETGASLIVILTCDNCGGVYNPEQLDADADGAGDVCDNCVEVPNPMQGDFDEDTIGDDCDNCPLVVNLSQADTDLDLVGDDCDNCILVENPDQADIDEDLYGDACDNCPSLANDQTDRDADGWGDVCDNCLYVPNTTQTDLDGDDVGDECDVCP